MSGAGGGRRRRRRWRGALLAGGITLFLVSLPILGIEAAAATGAMGSVGSVRLGVLAGITNVAIGAGSGWVVFRAANSEPAIRKGDLWSRWFVGLAAVVIGTWLVPLAVIFSLVDSDHGLATRPVAVVWMWLAGYAVVAGVGVALTKSLWDRPAAAGPGAHEHRVVGSSRSRWT